MIRYIIGDATRPIGTGPKIIAHVCNDVGRWGAGFTGALSRRWRRPEQDYRSCNQFVLGQISTVRVEADLWVVNMIAQRGIRWDATDDPPIRYDALSECLNLLGIFNSSESIHMPRIGCGLAGGTWNRVEPLIQKYLIGRGVNVTVYDLPGIEVER